MGRRGERCPAEKKLRDWLAEGGRRPLTLTPEEFAGRDFSLTALLFSGPLPAQLRQRWRSFCSWMATLNPFSSWKVFWYRRAGTRIGKDVFIAPGVVVDLLFPQLVTLEDEAVLGLGAIVVAHIYTPDRIVVAPAVVERRALLGGRAILAANRVGEEGVIAANSWPIEPIPAGYIAIGVPATLHERKSAKRRAGDER